MPRTVRDLLSERRSDLPFAPLQIGPDLTEVQKAVQIVLWVDGVLERRIWKGEEIETKLMKRGPEEILEEGHICFATPCFDLTSVTAELLKEAGLRPTVVISRMKRFLQPVGLQVGIEVILDDRPHIIGFGITSRRLQGGRYEIVGPRREVHRRPLEGETMARTHLHLFGIRSYLELPGLLSGYNPRRHLARFRRMMRPAVLRHAQERSVRKASRARPGHLPSAGRWESAARI